MTINVSQLYSFKGEALFKTTEPIFKPVHGRLDGFLKHVAFFTSFMRFSSFRPTSTYCALPQLITIFMGNTTKVFKTHAEQFYSKPI